MLNEYLGFCRPPVDLSQWLPDRRLREQELYLIRHGIMHHDPAGMFAQRRREFEQYPRPIWLRRINDELFDVWHFGQYNFLDRLVARADEVAIAIAIGRFIDATMRLSLLLDGDYAPYWKWLAFVFRRTDAAATLDPLLRLLASARTIEERIAPMRSICTHLHARLATAGLANPVQDHPHPLYCDMSHIASMNGGMPWSKTVG